MFLSYSRKDLADAEQIAIYLADKDFAVLRDMSDILPTEDWRERLTSLIEEADAVVFLLSPDSAKSEICSWEVELAARLGKKIAPIVIRDVEGSAIPPLLSRLNYIFATDRNRLENAVESLCDAFSGSAEWLRDYSKLLTTALDWERRDCPYERLLADLKLQEAVTLLRDRPTDVPKPSAIVVDFMTASEDWVLEVAAFNMARNQETLDILEPAIQSRIKLIYQELDNARLASHMLPAGYGKREEAEINDLQNLIVEQTRWHPRPAELVDGRVDAHGWTVPVYRFPCCGLESQHGHAISKAPRQLSGDGCRYNPQTRSGPVKLSAEQQSVHDILLDRVPDLSTIDQEKVRSVAIELSGKFHALITETGLSEPVRREAVKAAFPWGRLRNTFRGLPNRYVPLKEIKFNEIRDFLLSRYSA